MVEDLRQVTTRRASGFTLVEIMIVVALIGLLGAIMIPNFVRARIQSHRNVCINNLRQIEGAIQMWALENGGQTVPDTSTLLGYLRGKVVCPSGGTTFADSYALPATVTGTPTCLNMPQTHLLETGNGVLDGQNVLAKPGNGKGVNGNNGHGKGGNGNGNGGVGNGNGNGNAGHE